MWGLSNHGKGGNVVEWNAGGDAGFGGEVGPAGEEVKESSGVIASEVCLDILGIRGKRIVLVRNLLYSYGHNLIPGGGRAPAK